MTIALLYSLLIVLGLIVLALPTMGKPAPTLGRVATRTACIAQTERDLAVLDRLSTKQVLLLYANEVRQTWLERSKQHQKDLRDPVGRAYELNDVNQEFPGPDAFDF